MVPKFKFPDTEEGRKWQAFSDAYSSYLERCVTDIKASLGILATKTGGLVTLRGQEGGSSTASACKDLKAYLIASGGAYSVAVTPGLIWANTGDRDAGYDGVPDIGAGTVEDDPIVTLPVSATGKLWVKITIDDNVALNKIKASEFVYETTTPTETLPGESTDGVLYHPWANVTITDGLASLTPLQCGSKQWQYCGGGVGRLTPYE